MLPQWHSARLAEHIRNEVEELVSGELKDPRIGLATVTQVELTPDLSQARVWVSVSGDDEAKMDSLEGLSSAARYVRREIGQRLKLRRAPEVLFLLDRSAEDARKIEGLIDTIKRGNDARLNIEPAKHDDE